MSGEAPKPICDEADYRDASYDPNPRRPTWYAGGTVNDPFDIVQPEADNATWILIPGRTNPASVNIACYLDGRSPDSGEPEGVLPLRRRATAGWKTCPRFVIRLSPFKRNKTGAVLATGSGLMIF